MFDSRPQGWQAFALSVLGAIFYSIHNATGWLFASLLSAVCWTFGVSVFLWIALDVIIDMYAEAREASKLSTRAVELERASRLTEAQAQAVPAMTYQSLIGYAMTKDEEWIAYLITKDGNIPFEWTQKFLLECSSTRLRSIRSFVNGSQSQHYAQWFTAWLRDRGYAVGGEEESGKVAQWIDIETFAKVRDLFGLEYEDYAKQVADAEIASKRDDDPVVTAGKPATVQGD